MSAKEEFIEIFQEQIHREGAQALLDYLSNKSDFSPPRPRPGTTVLRRRPVRA